MKFNPYTHRPLPSDANLDEQEQKVLGGLWSWMHKESCYTFEDIKSKKLVYVWLVLLYDVKCRKGETKISMEEFEKHRKKIMRGKIPDSIAFEFDDELRAIAKTAIEQYHKVFAELKREGVM